MTHAAAADLRQWLVSARSRGELLTSTARTPGVELVMVGVPPGHSAEEVESWFGDLIAMAVETSSSESGERPIAPLLHHLLTGLLFSHSELWDRASAPPPASFAFVRTPNEVSFGWINGPAPDLWIDDHPAHVEWVKIRDHAGREASALAIDPSHRVRVHFGLSDGAASVDAAWVPAPVPEAASAPAAPASAPRAERVPQPVLAPHAAAASGDPLGIERASSTIARAVGARASVPESILHESAAAMDAGRVPPSPPAQTPEDGWTVVYESADSEPLAGESPRSGGWWSSMVGWMSGGKDRAAGGRRARPPRPARPPKCPNRFRRAPSPPSSPLAPRPPSLTRPHTPACARFS